MHLFLSAKQFFLHSMFLESVRSKLSIIPFFAWSHFTWLTVANHLFLLHKTEFCSPLPPGSTKTDSLHFKMYFIKIYLNWIDIDNLHTFALWKFTFHFLFCSFPASLSASWGGWVGAGTSTRFYCVFTAGLATRRILRPFSKSSINWNGFK